MNAPFPPPHNAPAKLHRGPPLLVFLAAPRSPPPAWEAGFGLAGLRPGKFHGGVRYLQQGRLGLVREALRERGRLLRNAPHLVRPLPFIVPAYRWWEQPWYGLGLGLYDLLAGASGFGPSFRVDRSRVLADLPNIAQGGLRGGVRYLDGQFDDAALAQALARLAAAQGAALVNYCPVDRLVQGRRAHLRR